MPTVLITGGARRIGAGLTEGLADAGYDIAFTFSSSEDEALRVSKRVEDRGNSCLTVKADLASEKDLNRVVEFVDEYNIRYLVNNAAIFEYDFPKMTDIALLNRCLQVNTVAAVRLMDAVAKNATEEFPASIVNILDSKVERLNPDYYSYSISKYALYGAGLMFGMGAGRDVRVNAVAPGITLPSGPQTQEEFEEAHSMNPLGRGATVDQIVRAVQLMFETSGMRDQVVTIDGGANLTDVSRDVEYLRREE